MVAGREVTPKDALFTERGKIYWLHHIDWGVPGDFDACVAAVTKAAGPGAAKWVKGYCSNLHLRATGERPGPNAHGGGAAHKVTAMVKRR